MDKIELYLQEAQLTLCKELELAALYARNPIAHKWKVTFRCLVIRELVSWRFFDLLQQAVKLQQLEHILGARILFRSAIETLAILIYTNQKMENIIKTGKGFHEFSDNTSRLLLGSRNKKVNISSINILTILEKCDKRYEGLMKLYADLSENAHPNYEGLMQGYSKTDYDDYKVNFKNCWAENFENVLEGFIDIFLTMFECEYNEQWPKNFEEFEKWIEENDPDLEATK